MDLVELFQEVNVIMDNKSEKYNKRWIIINYILIALGLIFCEKEFSVAVILLIWINLIFYGIQKRHEIGNALTLSNSKAIRGICAIEIMIGHIGIEISNLFQFPNRKAGILFVGLFFML